MNATDPAAPVDHPDPHSDAAVAAGARPAPSLLFNPRAPARVIDGPEGHRCVVVDDLLLNAQAIRDWACEQPLIAPKGYPYPGLVAAVPASINRVLEENFNALVRRHLGGRRTIDASNRTSLVCTPPAELLPVQWLCHRDRIAADARQILFAASVLYLFHDPRLGGTSLYRPRRSSQETDALLIDSQRLSADAFSARYGIAAGYMLQDNEWFERTLRVEAAFNRAVFYDGSIFHSADVDDPSRLSRDPRVGRLSINGFYTCRRHAS